jgi:hypothetical protein
MTNKYKYCFSRTFFYFPWEARENIADSIELREDKFFEDFYFLASELCLKEALTFQSDEIIDEIDVLYQKLFFLVQQYKLSILESGDSFRLFIAMFVCFFEWCDDIRYFQLSDEEKKQVWSENPLMSYEGFYCVD